MNPWRENPSTHLTSVLLCLHFVLHSRFLLIYLWYNAAAVSTDLSFNWLHHGLENEGVWGGKCKHTHRQKVTRGFTGHCLNLSIMLPHLHLQQTIWCSQLTDRILKLNWLLSTTEESSLPLGLLCCTHYASLSPSVHQIPQRETERSRNWLMPWGRSSSPTSYWSSLE